MKSMGVVIGCVAGCLLLCAAGSAAVTGLVVFGGDRASDSVTDVTEKLVGFKEQTTVEKHTAKLLEHQ